MGLCAQLHPCRISGDGDDWGGGDRPEGSDDDDDEEDQEEEDQEEDRPYAGPTTPALASRGRRLRPDRGTRRTPVRPVAFRRAVAFRGRAFQGTTSPVV